jgi:hypothetical protein
MPSFLQPSILRTATNPCPLRHRPRNRRIAYGCGSGPWAWARSSFLIPGSKCFLELSDAREAVKALIVANQFLETDSGET